MKEIRKTKIVTTRKPYTNPLSEIVPMDRGCILAVNPGGIGKGLTTVVEVPAFKCGNPENAHIGPEDSREGSRLWLALYCRFLHNCMLFHL